MEPRVAFCTHLTGSYEKASKMAAENGMKAIEHSFTEKSMPLLKEETEKIKAILGPESEVRYHAVFSQDDIGAADVKKARQSMKNLMLAVRAVSDAGGWFMTVHAGMGKGDADKIRENTVNHLKELVEFGNEHGVSVCVENLKVGATSDAQKLFRIVEHADIGLTFDVGHAAGSGGIDNNLDGLIETFNVIGPFIVNAHIYGKEDKNGHEAPESMDSLKVVLDQLIKTECDWWTIELGNPKDLNNMYEYIRGYLDSLRIGNNL